MSEKKVERISLIAGIVGDYDGAYDWIKEEDLGLMENIVGFHEGTFPEDNYTVIEVVDSEYAAQLEEEKAAWRIFKEQILMYRDMTIGGLSNDAQWIIERMNEALSQEKNSMNNIVEMKSERGFDLAISVWKDGTWKLWDAGGAWEAEGDSDWLCTINLHDALLTAEEQ